MSCCWVAESLVSESAVAESLVAEDRIIGEHPRAYTISEAQLDLGVRLLRAFSSDKNPIISPYSIHAALTLARIGARGDTARELDSLLFPSGYSSSVLGEYGELNRSLVHKGDELKLSLANSVWISEQGELNSSYLKDVKDIFLAEASRIDFSESDAARKKINEWISQRTEERIPELIPAHAIRPELIAVLVNALYFKASWLDPFSGPATPAPFWVSDGKSIEASMMRGTKSAMYYEDERWQAVSLGYQGGEFDFLAIVPKEKVVASELARQLESKSILNAVAGLKRERVEIHMPKFELRYRRELVDVLRQLGIINPFSKAADFSGITKLAMQINLILHEAFVKVDENGTEAAAATAVMMTRSALFLDQPKVVQIDRPFIALIWHKASRAPLFLGVIGEPEGVGTGQ
jgi:serpin B